ncbi:MAG: hypothetical protein ACT4O1_02235, partial [Gemmatimonadota bacterium]
LHAQLSVDELEVFIDPTISAERTAVIRITNDTDQAVQALLELQDWNRDDSGANQFYPPGTTSGSCGERLKVFPASVRIDAHRTESVRVSWDAGTPASCWGVVFIQANEPPKASDQQSQITYIIRTGVKVYVQPAAAARAGDVDSVRVTSMPASQTDTTTVPALEVLFRNSGQAHLKPTGAVEVRSADNVVVAKLDIAEFPIAPGDARRIRHPLPRMANGRYIALALIDYGGQEIAAAQLEFEIR